MRFPTTPEAFIAHQEQLVGQKMGEVDRAHMAAWVQVFNQAYMDGKNQNRESLQSTLQKLDGFITQRAGNAAELTFLHACRQRVVVAWEQGNQASAACMCSE